MVESLVKISYYGDLSIFKDFLEIDLVITDMLKYSNDLSKILELYPEVKFVDINTYIQSVLGKQIDLNKFLESDLIGQTEDIYNTVYEYLLDINNISLLKNNISESLSSSSTDTNDKFQELNGKLTEIFEKLNTFDSKLENLSIENRVIFGKLSKHV